MLPEARRCRPPEARRFTARVALLWLAWCLVPGAARGEDYFFRTIAGQAGMPGSADGTNQAALFNRPSYLAVDASGAVFVADTFNNTIRKLTPVGNDWVVTTIAGLAGPPGARDGTNEVAQFYSPNGLAFDPSGNLFVADHQNHTVRKVAPQGTNWVVTTLAGLAGVYGTSDGTGTNSRFRIPMGLAVDATDRLFVVDTANFTVRMVTPDASQFVVSTIAGTPLVYGFRDGLNEAAQFNYPYGTALGPDGALYVADSGNNALRQLKFDSKGWTVSTVANTRGLRGTDDGPARSATFFGVNGVVLDTATNMYVADQGNHTIRKLTWSGRDWDVSTIGGVPGVHGTTDGIRTNALFFMPWGVAVDRAGAVYVADAYNHTIRRGAPAILLEIASAAPGQARISWPTSPSGFRLERNRSFPNPNAWEMITRGVATVGGSYVVTNGLTNPAAVYRLKRDWQ